MTTPSNVRLQVMFNGFQLGSNGINTPPPSGGPTVFIDASQRPILLERRGQKFRFACELAVVGQTDGGGNANQDAFAATCATLERTLDPATGRNGSIRIESDTQLYEVFDRVTPAAAIVEAFGSLAGATFVFVVNGTSTTFTASNATQAGLLFKCETSNLQTAKNFAARINATLGSQVFASVGWDSDAKTSVRVYVQTVSAAVYSLTLTTTANPSYGLAYSSLRPGGSTSATQKTSGFNTECSILKVGSEDDTALSRRYAIEVSLDLPYEEVNKNGRRDGAIRIRESDSRRRQLALAGVYTALGAKTALEQYTASVDAWATSIQKALGGTWEGPFDVVAQTDNEASSWPEDGTGVLGCVLNFSRTYDELLYTRGLADDVRLRRQMLKVKFATEAPGDYGPKGRSVFRLRRAVITYVAGVDKTATQDLLTIWKQVVKPFLIDEAKKATGTSAIALTFQEPEIDRVENRIAAQVEILAASNGSLLESSVSTQDEEDAGVQLVAVWDGDPFSKQRYDGPNTLRRTVTQRFRVLSSPQGATAKGRAGGSDQFGIFSINQPSAFVLVTETSAREAAVDAFFGIDVGAAGSGVSAPSGRETDDEPGFSTSGGVPDPSGFTRTFRNGMVMVEPEDLGQAGDPQLRTTRITKLKVYEYHHTPTLPGGGPGREPTLNDTDPGGAGSALTTRSK